MIIANKYKIIEKLNNGEFGTIFKGENIRTKENVAIKMEKISVDTKMLKRETQIYQYLGKALGIPQVKWYGSTEEYNYMVLEYFYSGYPVLHNASDWSKYGYYYKDADIQAASALIDQIRKKHVENAEIYRAHTKALLWRHSPYNPEVQARWASTIGLGP